jgi:hypothetical protein
MSRGESARTLEDCCRRVLRPHTRATRRTPPRPAVRWDAKSSHEFIDNYKIIQQVFEKKGVDKHIGENACVGAGARGAVSPPLLRSTPFGPRPPAPPRAQRWRS